ncbi:hypothetical protein BDW59DRAFT_165843 [Aspergillus cavernicola]|uniref:BTB domain-containing protein n=1 Tax=Aspergillus cavernicola TaxID=176166 RepID=A0ABR4HQD7_9EURO
MGFEETPLTKAMNGLRQSKEYSDLSITCQERTFQVHRAIVCPQMPFLKAAMRNNFKEAAASHVDLPADDPDTIDRVFSWCYSGDYDSVNHGSTNWRPLECPSSARSTALLHFRVYIAADKFGMIELRRLAIKKLKQAMCSNRNSPEHPELVQQIWRLIPPHDNNGLRDAIVASVFGEGGCNIRAFQSKQGGKKVLENNPDFALRVLDKICEVFVPVKKGPRSGAPRLVEDLVSHFLIAQRSKA